MKVLMWSPYAGNVHGGHRVQLEQTSDALRSLGVTVVTSYSWSVSFADFDVVHGFGLDPGLIRAARRAGAVIALSTIYWARRYRREPDEWTRVWRSRLRQSIRLGLLAWRGPDEIGRRTAYDSDLTLATTYESADVLLPNSQAEADSIRAELGVTTPQRIVPNGIERDLLDRPRAPWSERSTVLCLGRIEPHKNQLGLIRALRPTSLQLDIVGFAHPEHPDYLQRCRDEAGPLTQIRASVAPSDVMKSLEVARVSVLPSWYETTGLASLEAAAVGANVVTTNRGFAAEYFVGDAWYCDPGSAESIRQAVKSAWKAPPQDRLRERIAQFYTWDRAAAVTLQAYEEALSIRASHSLGREFGA